MAIEAKLGLIRQLLAADVRTVSSVAVALLRDIPVREQRHRALVMASSDVVYRMNSSWTVMDPLDGRDLFISNDTPT